MILFHVSHDADHVRPEIEYVLRVWAKNQNQDIVFSEFPENAVRIGKGPENQLLISDHFVPIMNNPESYAPSDVNAPGPYLIEEAFHLLNCSQEYDSLDVDKMGRFKYLSSYQRRLNITRINVVQRIFDAISAAAGTSIRHEKTRFLLSHDIDLIHGAILEDGFHVLKRGRLDLFMGMLFKIAIGRPDWLNMDQIMKLESEHDCRSIFFWLVNQGKINRRERNADYDFHARKIQDRFLRIRVARFENGLHKSISTDTMQQEISKFGQQPNFNRYHYLKFRLPYAFHDIEAAGLRLDASLGFAEEIGFRNSYGLPFNPFNTKTRAPFTFVEAPLHVMDRTYFQYKRFSPEKAEKDIISFFEMNRQDCVLSVLWHNNFFTNYKFKGYLGVYKRILSYIRENKFETISAEEIVNHYSIHV